jgi:hypothetical protein
MNAPTCEEGARGFLLSCGAFLQLEIGGTDGDGEEERDQIRKMYATLPRFEASILPIVVPACLAMCSLMTLPKLTQLIEEYSGRHTLWRALSLEKTK